MTDIQALQAQLTQQSGELSTRYGSFVQNGDAVRTVFNSLREVWDGDASTAFMEGASVWQQGYQQAIEAFKTMNDQFESVRVEMANLEARSAGTAGGAWQ